MEGLESAKQLATRGRFAEALTALDKAAIDRIDRTGADVLRAELLERTGRLGQSRALTEKLLKLKELGPTDRSKCESVIGLIEAEDGNLDSAVLHMQRSLAMAKQSNDLERVCWSQLRLLPILADRSGSEAITPLVAELYSNATKLGNRKVMAALHIFVGQTEAKRGLLDSARRHSRLGIETLSSEPDLALEAMAETTLLNVAMMRSEFDTALAHARRGAQAAHESGAAVWRRAFLANQGRLFFLMGRFDEAVDQYEQALSVFPSSGDNGIASLYGLAELRLTQGRVSECARLLDRVEQSVPEPMHRVVYGYRHMLPMRSQLLARQGDLLNAFEMTASTSAVAETAGDHLLRRMALLTKAELLQQVHKSHELLATLDNIVVDLRFYPDLYGHYERTLACALAAADDINAARGHFDRAKRVYESIHNVPGLIELNRRWELALSQGSNRVTTRSEDSESGRGAAPRGTILQSTAAIMLHAARPELIAREMVHLLRETDCVQSATAISRTNDGETETLASTGTPDSRRTSRATMKHIPIGVARDRSVELLVEPKADVESAATLNAVTFLLSTVHDLERARAEREERLTLWPIEDVPLENGQAVVSGHMRELMAVARRIATTTVSVLITGGIDPQSDLTDHACRRGTKGLLGRLLDKTGCFPLLELAA